jgi:hemerythrin-like domain-containing protein
VFLKIGQARRRGDDVVELLLECHDRIRNFTALARAIGERSDDTESDAVDACARVERYFCEALPLHEADEEQSVLPRLQGRSAEVEQALAAMQEQHGAHAVKVADLLAASTALRGSPSDGALRHDLAAAARELQRAFDAHLELEERVIFPALAALPPEVRAALVSELRARRTVR